MAILVTGGAGYIGSHVVMALADKCHDVVVVDNLVYGHMEVLQPLERVKLVKGDIGDRALMRRVFAENRIEAVMHFSAYAYVGESVQNPAKYYRNNVSCMINLLDETISAGCQKFIFSSTCATYGCPTQMPITEDCPQRPINPYGASKLMAERILEDYETAYGLKSVIFRYFNAAGADPAGRSGENHTPETHLIPLVLDVAAGRNPHITVFGDDYDTDDGTCVRDYIHVSDIASAHLLGLDFLEEYETSERFNLANAVGYSVKQVIDSVSRITNRPIKTVYAKRRAGDPPVLIGNASKALSILGWKPQFTELDTIVKHAWKWHQQLIGF